MKAGRWCEVIVSSAVIIAWSSPIYADCVTCFSRDDDTFSANRGYVQLDVQQKAQIIQSYTPHLPAAALFPVLITSSGVALVPEAVVAPEQLHPSHSTVVEFTPSTTALAHSRFLAASNSLTLSSSTEEFHRRSGQPSTKSSVQFDMAQTFVLQKIVVTGNTAISDAEIAEITRPLEGTTVDFQKLQAVADSITQLYLDRGYLTSRAIIPEQTAANGAVTIQVIEGGLERIEVQGNQRVSTEYIRSRVALGGITPLRQDRLEDQLRLLRSDPLFENVEASLRAGEGIGKSILTVRVTEASPFLVNFSADNYSPPSVGSEKLGLGFGFRNITGAGDQFLASYSFSTTSGSSLFDFSYRYPLNPMNGIIQLRFAPSSYRITDPTFAAFGIRGTTDLYDITFRQPLVRSPREEFALSLGFTYQRGQTFLFNNIPQQFGIGPDADGVSTTSVLKFGQDYISRDVQGAWALRSQFNIGLGIFGATSNADPVPDGSFFSWLLQAQRVQLLSPDQLLIIQADLQLAANTLLPSQQFVIGGGQSVRGFRQNVRSGDNGFRFSIENRITVQRDESGAALVRLAPFIDIGAVWNVDGNPNLLPSQTFLAAAGIGFLWEPLPRLNIRLDYAVPFINLNDRGINVQDSAFYFSVNYGI